MKGGQIGASHWRVEFREPNLSGSSANKEIMSGSLGFKGEPFWHGSLRGKKRDPGRDFRKKKITSSHKPNDKNPANPSEPKKKLR